MNNTSKFSRKQINDWVQNPITYHFAEQLSKRNQKVLDYAFSNSYREAFAENLSEATRAAYAECKGMIKVLEILKGCIEQINVELRDQQLLKDKAEGKEVQWDPSPIIDHIGSFFELSTLPKNDGKQSANNN